MAPGSFVHLDIAKAGRICFPLPAVSGEQPGTEICVAELEQRRGDNL